MVSYKQGIVRDIPGIDELRALPSFRRLELMTQPGASIIPTIDCFSRSVIPLLLSCCLFLIELNPFSSDRPGSVQLVNKNPEQLQKDYDSIRTLEHDGLFIIQN